MQLRLASTCSNPAHLGDLFMLVSLDVVQNENVPRAGWKLRHRIRQIHVVTVSRSYIPSLHWRFITPCIVLDQPHPFPAFCLPVRENDVHCDSMNPRRERRFSSELRKFFPGSYKNILSQLLPAYPASAHSRADREHPVHVCFVQSLESAPVSRDGEPHIGRVVHHNRRLDHHRCCHATLVTLSRSVGYQGDCYFRRNVSGPLVVMARIVAPPEPRSVEMSRLIRPETVTGNPRLTGPLVVPVSRCAE